MKKMLMVVIAVLFFYGTVWAKAEVNLISVSDGYVLEYELAQWRVRQVDTLGFEPTDDYRAQQFSRLEIQDYFVTDEIGKAELPVLTFHMAILGEDQVPTYEILDPVKQQVSLQLPVFPVQPPWPKSMPASQRVFTVNSGYYRSQGEENPVVRISEPFVIRGVTCVTVKILPFSYNPAKNTLTILQRSTIRLKTHTAPKYAGLDSREFEKLLKSSLVNFETVVEPVRSKRKENYLIITAPEYESSLAEFVQFREARFKVTLVTTSTTGTSASAIIDYIKKQYNNTTTRPTFLLLVGDVNKIPASQSGKTTSDLKYAAVESSRPDIFVGRFSVSSTTDLENVVKKTIHMEMNLKNIAKNNLFVGGQDKSNGHIAEKTHNAVIQKHFDPAGYKNIKRYTNSDNTATEDKVKGDINGGLIFSLYSGHGSKTAWAAGDWSLTTTDIKGLTNTTSFPFTYTFACYTGDFAEECCSEAWIRAKNGAVTSWASSVPSMWGPDDKVERGMVDAMADDSVTLVSSSFIAGLIYNNTSAYFQQYNLLGDPGLETIPVNTAPFIGVSFPNGKEQLQQYSTVVIRWGSNIDDKVNVELLQGGNVKETLAASIDNVGKFEWRIPESFPTGSDYKIRVKSTVTDTLVDESDNAFSIIKEALVDNFPFGENFDTFDTGTVLKRNWEQLDGDDFDWIVQTGPTPSKVGNTPDKTGPDGDHTSGNGNYLYVESSSPNYPGKKAGIISPKFNLNAASKAELRFWSHIFSDTTGNLGDLWMDIEVDGQWKQEVLHFASDSGDRWFETKLDLTPYKGKRVRFRFRGQTGNGWAGDMCIDDFQIISKNNIPVFVSTPDTEVKAGKKYSYKISVSDADNDKLSLTAPTLPDWLELKDNGNGTGELSGTPGSDDVGDNDVVISVTDKIIAKPIEQKFTIAVAQMDAPHITAHPKDLKVTEGEQATFAVEVQGDELSYQWQADGKNIADAHKGTYKIDKTELDQDGMMYRCIVSNAGGKDTSNYAKLTVEKITSINTKKAHKELLARYLTFAPNPALLPNQEIVFTFDGTDYTSATVLIIDNIGNDVFSLTFPAGQITRRSWDLRSNKATKVAGGTYGLLIKLRKADGTILGFTTTVSVQE